MHASAVARRAQAAAPGWGPGVPGRPQPLMKDGVISVIAGLKSGCGAVVVYVCDAVWKSLSAEGLVGWLPDFG